MSCMFYWRVHFLGGCKLASVFIFSTWKHSKRQPDSGAFSCSQISDSWSWIRVLSHALISFSVYRTEPLSLQNSPDCQLLLSQVKWVLHVADAAGSWNIVWLYCKTGWNLLNHMLKLLQLLNCFVLGEKCWWLTSAGFNSKTNAKVSVQIVISSPLLVGLQHYKLLHRNYLG